MSDKRKITVATTIRFDGLIMESTDDAIETVKGIIATLGHDCQREIKQALEDAGAKDVTIGMVAY